MTFSSAAVPAAETALLNRNAPYVVANSVLDRCVSVVWSNQTGIIGDTDNQDTNYETWYLSDRSRHRRSRPSSADTEWFIVAQLQPNLVFDTIAFIDHTIYEGPNHAVTVTIADSSDFTSNPTAIYGAAGISQGTALYALGTRYTNVEFLRVQMTFSSGYIPEIGELWIGQRRQLGLPSKAYDHLGRGGALRRSGPPGAADILPSAGNSGGLVLQFDQREIGETTLRGMRTDSRMGADLVAVVKDPITTVFEVAICAFEEQRIKIGNISNPQYYGSSFKLIESAPRISGL